MVLCFSCPCSCSIQLFKEELTQVKEGMKHINDLAHQLAISNVHLSMENARALEHLNSRWKVLQVEFTTGSIVPVWLCQQQVVQQSHSRGHKRVIPCAMFGLLMVSILLASNCFMFYTSFEHSGVLLDIDEGPCAWWRVFIPFKRKIRVCLQAERSMMYLSLNSQNGWSHWITTSQDW